MACSSSSRRPDPGFPDVPDVPDVASVDPGPDVGADVQAPPGCPAYTANPGGEVASISITPATKTLEIPLGKAATLQFKATLNYKDGTKADLMAGDFTLTNPAIGYLDNNGLFTSADNTGGESYVTLSVAGACGSAYLRVVQTWSGAGDSGISDPAAFAAQTLSPATGPDGPALLYPPDGALVPSDFPALTVQYTAATAGDAGIVRFEAAAARFDFLFSPKAAQTADGYRVTLDAAGFSHLFEVNGADSYAVSVLIATLAGDKVSGTPVASAARTLFVTPQKAGGAFYYWNTGGINGSIRFLEMGKEKSVAVKLPTGGCVGCHSISPDASVLAVSPMGFAGFNLALGDPVTGKKPSWVHADAEKQYSNGFTISPAFSPHYWTDTDKRMVVPSSTGGMMGKAGLYNIDLLTGKSNVIVKGGDPGSPAFPTWSTSGAEVVYTSGPAGGQSAFAINGPCKLYRVPYNDGAGGPAVPLEGAADEGVLQFYPAFSPDGQWIVYNRAEDIGIGCPQSGGSAGATNSGGTYDNCKADIFIVPSQGGTPVRLGTANGDGSPGMTNSWPTFGVTIGKYYWIAFSSRRDYGFLHKGDPAGSAAPQIWIAGVDPSRILQGIDGSFAALWLPFQEIDSGNHIARWGVPPREPL
jgi:hypothetical protein